MFGTGPKSSCCIAVCECTQRGHWKVRLSSAACSGWTRMLHMGALHFKQSGRPSILSTDEWPLNVIFRLPRLGESATISLATILVFGASTAHAKGCLKGAVVGGVAGHYAGHHGVLGAAAGCVVGRHEAKKHERERIQEDQKNRELHNDGERL